MDMSVGKKEEIVKKDKKPAGKGKKDDKKSKPPAGLPEMRSRAKSTVVNTFEQKKGPNIKKDVKPIETIGNDRFKNLLSMFDKKPEAGQSKEDAAPQKLDMSKFAFGKATEDSQTANGPKKGSELADGIKKRMEALMSNNKEKERSASYIDPVLEQRRKQKELEGDEDEEEEDYDDESEENLHISEDEDEHKEEENFDEDDKEDDKEDLNDKDDDKEDKEEDKDGFDKEDDSNKHEDDFIDNQKEMEKKEEHKDVEEDI